MNQALREKRPEYRKRQHKVILLHDDAPSRTAKPVKETIEAFGWEILSHAAYSPDLAPPDYYLFASMGHALSDQRFASYENVRKCLDDWFASKERQLFLRGIHRLPDRWEKCMASDGRYFEENIFNHFHTTNVYFLYKNSGFVLTHLVKCLMSHRYPNGAFAECSRSAWQRSRISNERVDSAYIEGRQKEKNRIRSMVKFEPGSEKVEL